MPYDGETRMVSGRKDRYNAKKGAWETNVGGSSSTSGLSAPAGVNAASEAAKFKARNQAEAIESKKSSAAPAPASVISPLGKAAEEAAKRRKKKADNE